MRWQQRANFATLVTWLLATAVMAASALFFFGLHGHDFRSFYAAGRIVLAGGDPYDFGQVAALLHALTGEVGNYPFFHPPWFAVVLAPFALLPHLAARGLWLACNVVAWIGALLLLTRTLQWPLLPWQRWLLFLAATYLFAWFTWRFEQVGVLLFLLLTVALWAAQQERWMLYGSMAALLLTKPTVSALLVGALLLWAARQKKWRALQGFSLTLLLLALLSAPLLPTYLHHLATPGFTQGLTRELAGTTSAGVARINTTLRDWLASFGLAPPLIAGIYGLSGLASLGAIFTAFRRRAALLTIATIATLATFWITPYALQYDFPLLTLPLFVALRALPANSRRTASCAIPILATVLLAAILSVPLWERPISDGFWIVIGTTALYGLGRQPHPPVAPNTPA